MYRKKHHMPDKLDNAVISKDEMTQEEIDCAISESELLYRNFVSCRGEPAFTFSGLRISVNNACVRKAMDHDYIQILINRQKKLLIVRPCEENELHSFQWCVWKEGRKLARPITAKIFYMKVYSMMGWNPEDRYRVIGKVIRSNDQEMILFNLLDAERYERMQPANGKRGRTSRTPVYPVNWRDQFGIPYEGHQKALQVNLFDGYAVFSVNGSLTDTPILPVQPSSNTVVSQAAR